MRYYLWLLALLWPTEALLSNVYPVLGKHCHGFKGSREVFFSQDCKTAFVLPLKEGDLEVFRVDPGLVTLESCQEARELRQSRDELEAELDSYLGQSNWESWDYEFIESMSFLIDQKDSRLKEGPHVKVLIKLSTPGWTEHVKELGRQNPRRFEVTKLPIETASLLISSNSPLTVPGASDGLIFHDQALGNILIPWEQSCQLLGDDGQFNDNGIKSYLETVSVNLAYEYSLITQVAWSASFKLRSFLQRVDQSSHVEAWFWKAKHSIARIRNYFDQSFQFKVERASPGLIAGLAANTFWSQALKESKARLMEQVWAQLDCRQVSADQSIYYCQRLQQLVDLDGERYPNALGSDVFKDGLCPEQSDCESIDNLMRLISLASYRHEHSVELNLSAEESIRFLEGVRFTRTVGFRILPGRD
ncbi:hypothetical protein [Pseudobacteriovorax antillogorgiicola]|uniref:Uncharacterized protein n=1 Tax=Pseudobacteriovorax antillogorgiicola TaxID=1513793 RepID=A0A1Y6C8I0_9BACT|nr:hypothetical protein [Pseudobacteriovorax antillogorgiicola]TCS50660.1 hypothetical protein EDD56_11242 [Pseudobacteriovorax antillogorgiicola]SMF39842.1 hypothetical protein SAMN06296036_11241 [Pseudobacteriovorax antillogorgiicola]